MFQFRSRTIRPNRLLLASLLAVAVPLSAQTASKNDTRPTIAVLYLTNGALADNATYAPLSKGIAEMLITELAQNNALRVVERDRLQTLLEEQNLQSSDRVDKETALKLGKILGSRHMLMGSFVIDLNRNMRIDVRAVNTETSAIDYVETVSGKSDKLLELVIQLGAKVNAGLKLPALKMASATTPASKSPNQFKALLAMSRALEAEDTKDIEGAKTLYKSAIAMNPDFDRARIRLASMELGR
ncbi:MAG: CsgG/HfaB family protein [Gemmatimonadaceae bacterium]|nr:CsgG/HfaB family protein [Gemmatimonadaceae bacterium]